jgi:hypothetical protein
VTSLHRTEGSFTAGASHHSIMVPGELARLGVVAAGALLFFAIGAAFGARRRNGSDRA